MKIILDECLPCRLMKEIRKYNVTTVPKAGFAGFKNGKLLSILEKNYDVFITMDSNLEYQQNLRKYDIAIISLKAISNSLNDLMPLIPEILKALNIIKKGELIKLVTS